MKHFRPLDFPYSRALPFFSCRRGLRFASRFALNCNPVVSVSEGTSFAERVRYVCLLSTVGNFTLTGMSG